MAPASPGPPSLCLTLLDQSGTVSASLTDFRGLARFGQRPLPPPMLERLLREPPPGSVDAQDIVARGRELFDALLPDSIKDPLRLHRCTPLILQLSPSLLTLPWELAFDGEHFLGAKFSLTRQVVDERAAPMSARPRPRGDSLRVLLMLDNAADESQFARLGALAGLELRPIVVGQVDRESLLEALAACDCAHFVGSVDGDEVEAGARRWWAGPQAPDSGELAALNPAPMLLISQDRGHASAPTHANVAFATAASGRGLCVVACGAAGAPDGRIDCIEQLYRGLLQGQAIGDAVRIAREQALASLGVPALANWRAECYGDVSTAVVASSVTARAGDDLRQLTVMSFDLVDSTRLMIEIGAERFSDLLLEYHRVADRILRAHGGKVDDPQGDDGSMCYFGFPVAHEDAALRALRAGRALLDAVHAIGLEARVGVATGSVVIRSGQPVGPAVHLAARLQTLATPGTMVVGRTTRQIVGAAYRFRPFASEVELKGFDHAEAPFLVVAPQADQDGGEPTLADPIGPRLTPLVGRERELQALRARWTDVCAGNFRAVLLVGDAGIGKSRLVREFKRPLLDQRMQVFEIRCAPEHRSSAFRPLVEALRSQLHIRPGDGPEQVLHKLLRLTARDGTMDGEGGRRLAELLAPLPAPSTAAVAPERQRQLTMAALVALGLGQVRRAPACMIVEDVHWVDPSTAEFLDRFVSAARGLPLMLLVTRREQNGPWQPTVPFDELCLQTLSPEMARSMVVAVSGASRLPTEVMHLIAARADGVPLFIEESTRIALESGAAGAVASAASALPVPSTLLDLLTARLDRIGPAKTVAQVCGVIGRSFPLRLLEEVLAHPQAPLPVGAVHERLAELVDAGLMSTWQEGDDRRYAFRHALMRDAAYRSLLERQRLQLHRVVAEVIGARFAELAADQPEMLAFHHTEAGMDEEALRSWEAAARHAASRSAHAESISHVLSALGVLARRPPGAERDRIELRLQLLLAARLIATEGYGARRVETAYLRAAELASALGDDVAAMKVLLGLEGYHFMRGDFAAAKEHAARAQARLDRAAPIFRVQVQWAQANVLMHEGEMAAAVQKMDACLAAYDQLEHRPEAVQDPGVMCLCYSAWSKWQLGQPDQALQRVEAVVERAERLHHKFSLGEAYGFRAAVRHFRGENREAMASADRAVALCEDAGFVVWLAHARLMRGRIRADLGDVAGGIEEMRQGYESWAATGAVVTTPFYLAMRAEGLALAGRHDEGLALLAQAQATVNRTGERYYEAEVRRLTGQLTLAAAERAGLDRRVEVEATYWHAHEIASRRQLRSLALRSAQCLAEFYLGDGRAQRAVEVLRPALEAISEGAQTRDLVKARSQLADAQAALRPMEQGRTR